MYFLKTKAGDTNDNTKPKADEKLDLTKPENGVDPNLPEDKKVDPIKGEEDEKNDATEAEGKKDVAELEEEEDDDEDESNWKRRKVSKDDDLSMVGV